MSNKVYQVQRYNGGKWVALSTKSGGTYCNTMGGARRKICKFSGRFRIVSFELVNEEVVYEEVSSE